MAGGADTLIEREAEIVPMEAVTVVDPGATARMVPPASTVAMAGDELAHVAPLVAMGRFS